MVFHIFLLKPLTKTANDVSLSLPRACHKIKPPVVRARTGQRHTGRNFLWMGPDLSLCAAPHRPSANAHGPTHSKPALRNGI